MGVAVCFSNTEDVMPDVMAFLNTCAVQNQRQNLVLAEQGNEAGTESVLRIYFFLLSNTCFN